MNSIMQYTVNDEITSHAIQAKEPNEVSSCNDVDCRDCHIFVCAIIVCIVFYTLRLKTNIILINEWQRRKRRVTGFTRHCKTHYQMYL